MRPEGLGQFKNLRPSGLQHSALTTTLPRAPGRSANSLRNQIIKKNNKIIKQFMKFTAILSIVPTAVMDVVVKRKIPNVSVRFVAHHCIY
jgi:hypothetical protein